MSLTGSPPWSPRACSIDRLARRTGGEELAEPRFGMLETLREFGIEQLEARGQAEELRHRHAIHCVALVETNRL